METSTSENMQDMIRDVPLREILVPISTIMIIVSFQLVVILPVTLLLLQALVTFDTSKIILNNQSVVTLILNFMLQVAGFVVAATLLLFRKRSLSHDRIIITMQLDIGAAMRQLSVLQFVRIVGLLILISMLQALGLSVNDVSANPYLTFAEALEGSYLAIILLVIVFVILGPLFEELMFRVLLVTELERVHVHEGLIMFLSGLIFGLAHVQTNLLLAIKNGSYTFMLIHLFNSTITGVILAYVYLRTRSLLTIWFMHAVFNFLGTASLLGIEEFVMIFNIFLFFLGVYFVIRHHSLIPIIFRNIKHIIIRTSRNGIELGVLVISPVIQLVFEVFIPVSIVLVIQDALMSDVMLTAHGFLSFVFFLLYVVLVTRKRKRGQIAVSSELSPI